MKYIVNDKVWTKHDLCEALYYYNSNHCMLTHDDIEYAIGNYYYSVDGKVRSTIDDMELRPRKSDGGCDLREYVHYNPIKTDFDDWPIIYSTFNDNQPIGMYTLFKRKR